MFAQFRSKLHAFVLRHRAHCADHPVYVKECRGCVDANGGGIVLYDDPSRHIGEMPPSPQYETMPATDSNDFGGFEGGDSGGGGASGDF